MSELVVGSIAGLAANSYVVSVASGSKLVQPGSVLQVVSTTKTDTFSTSIGGDSFSSVVTGLTATITPSSTSSKILVQVSVTGSGINGAYLAYALDRNGTAIGTGTPAGTRQGLTVKTTGYIDTNASITGTMSYLDSPASTSALTYGVKLHNQAGISYTFHVNRTIDDTDGRLGARPISTITLIEVAG